MEQFLTWLDSHPNVCIGAVAMGLLITLAIESHP